MAAAGYFGIYDLAVLFFVRDVGLDGIYYALGHYGSKTRFVQRMLGKIHVTSRHLEGVKLLWDRYPMRTMFIGKISYGIASTFIVIAGMVGMPLKKFFGYGSLVAIAQYGSLLVLGYFLGAAYGNTAAKVLQNIQYIILGTAIILTAYWLVSLRMRKRFLADEHLAEHEAGGPSLS